MLRKTSNKRLAPIPIFLRTHRQPTALSARRRLGCLKSTAEIYAKVTSKYAVAYLNDKNTVLTYDIKVDHIINRSGTGMCPMEKAVLNVNNADEGEKLIRDTINSMMKG